jgi:hypothetical protein
MDALASFFYSMNQSISISIKMGASLMLGQSFFGARALSRTHFYYHNVGYHQAFGCVGELVL